jgi:hypothetical protein
MGTWVEREWEGGQFPDQRLKTRLGTLLRDLGQHVGSTVPVACQDWAATKAAYRFFDNPRVDEGVILGGHFAATADRFATTSGTVLVLHDTTEFSFRRDAPEKIGFLGRTRARRAVHTVCGLLTHSALVLTTDGLPLGLAAVKFWTRKKFKGTRALRNRVNLTRIPIQNKESVRWVENVVQSTKQLGEPSRCVHVCDREADIFELFCATGAVGAHVLIRTCVDRSAGWGGTTISQKMAREPIRGEYEVEVRDDRGRVSKARVHLRFCRMTIHPPVGKQKTYPSLSLTVIHAHERGKPTGRDPIRWHLLTDLPVETVPSAIEKLDWYALRWNIETYHKVLKSGCQAERLKLRTADRLTNLLAVFCIIGWRVFWLTMSNRVSPDAPAEAVLTSTEIQLLDQLEASTTACRAAPAPKPIVSHYLMTIAKLGGYLARAKDPPPGNMVLWRGLSRLTDIHLGYELHNKVVGN